MHDQKSAYVIPSVHPYAVKSDFSHVILVVQKHPPSIKKRCYCPQTFLYLDFQCKDDMSDVKYTFRG